MRPCAIVLLLLLLAAPAFSRGDDDDIPPRYNAKTMTGEKFTNESLKGKVVLLEFWATWCPYCKEEEPLVDRIDQQFRDQGLVVLAVDVNESKKTVLNYLKQHPRKVRIVLTEDTNLAAWFAAKSYPIYVVIGRDGQLSEIQRGAGGETALLNKLRRAGIKVD